MLPERDRELLTAYVDGVLSSRQRRSVTRLLQLSTEARELLHQLQGDARSLRDLPRIPPVEDLSASVLRTIFERGLHHARRQAAASAVSLFPTWAGLVAAAAVLLVAGLGSYLYFASSLAPRHEDAPAPSESLVAEKKPLPNPNQLALVSLHSLEESPKRRKLTEDLNRTTAAHLELPCRDSTHAMRRLLTALKTQKIEGIIEPSAQGQLKNPARPTNYAVYIDDMTAEELTQLFRAVGAEEKKGSGQSPPAVGFTGQLVVARMAPEDHKQLTQMLGVDPTQVRDERPTDFVTFNPNPPAKGQGAGNPGPVHHVALVMTYGSLHPKQDSAEIKRFLASRKSARPGTIPVLLLVCNATT